MTVPTSDADRRLRLLADATATLGTLSDVLNPLGERFAAAGHELFLVGGSVRDAILGRFSGDLDFTTDARPEKVQALLKGWVDKQWDTGIEFGTISAIKHGQEIEITTFRADAYDRVSRNPIVEYGTTLADDLVRRDFTVNAMAMKIGADGSYAALWEAWSVRS